ncbi:MAG: porin [Verrucomicrobiales bacterium]|jgi:hypothetical protein|nr:porin [Verrucomicrobiales bacterium]
MLTEINGIHQYIAYYYSIDYYLDFDIFSTSALMVAAVKVIGSRSAGETKERKNKMNKLITGLFSAALIANAAFADGGAPAPSAKDLSKAVEKINYVEADTAGVKLSGYVDVGYTYNFYNGYNLFRNGTDLAPKGDFNVNAVKLTLAKDLGGKNTWDAGFRVDAMVGEDAGGSASSLFLQQAYVTANAPLSSGVVVKAGKFIGWLGYEAPDRPANLNITYGDIAAFIPTYFTGVSAEYKLNDIVDFGLAVANGSNLDSNTGSGFIADHDATGDGYGIMAKVNFTVPGGNANWQHALYYSWDARGEDFLAGKSLPGDISSALAGAGFGGPLTVQKDNFVVYDGIINWVPKFTNGKLLLGVNYDIIYANLGSNYGVELGNVTMFGGAGYAKYQFNDIFSLAARVSYLHLYNNYLHYVGLSNSDDLWSATLTAGFNVAENLVIRAEYRFDLGNNRVLDYNIGSATLQSHDSGHTVAIEAVYTF